METFNSNNFIKSLKKSYGEIPYLQGDRGAKILVSDSIKSNGFNPEDVLAFIYSTVKASPKLSDEEWKAVLDAAIKRGGVLGKSLEMYKSTLKGKISNEEMFNLAAKCCGVNPVLLQQELCLNKLNWERVLETLIKTAVEAPAPIVSKEEEKVETKVKKTKKHSIKTPKVDPRSKSITLFNEDTKELKTWPSYRSCEKELYGEDGGHGMVSQLFDPKKGLKRLKGGWILPKEEEKTPEKEKAHKRAVIQLKKDKRGHLRAVNTFNSITEASQVTGISHSGISKVCSGTYQSTGGFVWKYAEGAA
ncbi:MAG: hypothetical protein II659_00165 [Bacteroidales bacterium]|nr:hypothetical protein [Bacteroidales bacterium]